MTKKNIICLSALILMGSLLITSLVNQKSAAQSLSNDLPTISTEAKFVKYNKINDLEEAADLIIVGTPSQEFKDRDRQVKRFKDGLISDFYTNTNINVEKVIKKPSDLDINQTINIIEPVSTLISENRQQKITTEHYQELKKDSKYIIFLKKNSFGNYSIINMESGKFNLDSTDPTDLPEDKQSKVEKDDLKKNIVKKYSDKL
ncbi:hypothetical protein OB236_17890 [Paenibacillus sp. WQ 127069]|uniref:Uncharacterized protein n=1 Tax=Paenibacillus baimaensis TaxID=2982185 RepID=A0ABT2UH68_9BACL|nr:hypothetical protein [Paenibacillus sp. WQ 127069]